MLFLLPQVSFVTHRVDVTGWLTLDIARVICVYGDLLPVNPVGSVHVLCKQLQHLVLWVITIQIIRNSPLKLKI